MLKSIVSVSFILAFFAISTTVSAKTSYTFQDNAELQCGAEIVNESSSDDLGHLYTFEASADQETTFAIDYSIEEDRRHGAVIWVYDISGNLVDYAISWFTPTVELTVTVERAGEYLVFVSPLDFWGTYSEYPYALSANCLGGLCVALVLSGVNPDPGFEEFEVLVARSFPAGSEEEAASWWPNNPSQDDVTLIERRIYDSVCPEVVLDDCTEESEIVCAGDMSGGATYENICEVEKFIFERAYDDREYFGWYAMDWEWSDEDGQCVPN